jgi:hypothetical protein
LVSWRLGDFEFTNSPIRQLTNSPTHHSPTHQFAKSPIRQLTNSPTHQFANSPIRQLTIRQLTNSPTHQFANSPFANSPFANSPIRQLTNFCIRSSDAAVADVVDEPGSRSSAAA